jgi:signal transduction histidine kinase
LACWSSDTALEVENAIHEILAGIRESFGLEYACARRGIEHWFEMHITRFAGEGPIRLVVRHDEITERKRADLDRQLYASRVKQLGAHLESVREEQNSLIARELHDELGACMTMLKLGLASAAADASKGAVKAARLKGLIDLVDSGLQVVKRISGDLRPATLDTLGLVATIKWYLAQFTQTTGLHAELNLPHYVRLPDPASIAVFRIIQEGLTNVARHSGADRVRVRMYKHRGALILRIVDNGSGVREGDLERHESFGIIGMRERAQHLGGRFAITNRASGGTRLTLQIPLHD